MTKCENCGSYAINHHAHGRDGSDGHLCDVCYWRKRADSFKHVLTVKVEPDYFSGGHYYRGSKPHVDVTKVWGIPIGTKLFMKEQNE